MSNRFKVGDRVRSVSTGVVWTVEEVHHGGRFVKINDLWRGERELELVKRSLPQEHRSTVGCLAVPERSRSYQSDHKCSACWSMVPIERCAVVSARGEKSGICEKCFSFMWHAATEELLAPGRLR